MITLLLSDLYAGVRQRADIENATDRFPQDEVIGYINTAAAKWHGMLCRSYEGFFLDKGAITVSSGNMIALSSAIPNFYQLVRVQYADTSSPSGWRKVTPVTLEDLERVAFSPLGNLRGYMLTEDAITLFPELAATGTYRIWFQRDWQPFNTGDMSQAFPSWLNWHELVILEAAIMCMQKDREDWSDLGAALQRVEADIRAGAKGRDVGAPHVTLDVQDTLTPWVPGYR